MDSSWLGLVQRLSSRWRLRRRLVALLTALLITCLLLNVAIFEAPTDMHPLIALSHVLPRHGAMDGSDTHAAVDSLSSVVNLPEPAPAVTVPVIRDADSLAEEEERPQAVEPPVGQTCEAYLEVADSYEYSRDYWKTPIVVERNQDHIDRTDCDLGCHYTTGYGPFDASYISKNGQPGIKYTMESYTNYPDTKLENAKQSGYEIVMTPRLDADVSVVYFGWNSFDPMRPAVPGAKKDKALAAFISNCGARSFRNLAVGALMAPEANLTVESYGACMRNMNQQNGRAEKRDIFPRVKFSLAFENSEEPDYVTEKFFQSIDYGAVPIVIGAPNIQDFAPAPNSILHLKSKDEIPALIERVQYLMKNDTAYDEMHAYKRDGPTDNFLALIDLGITHPDCRLCIVLADRQRRHEREDKPKDRPCTCKDKGSDRIVHHLYIRERGKFEFKSIYMTHPLSVAALHAKIHSVFGSDYKPVWTLERPSYRKKLDNGTWDRAHQPLRVHKIYPAGSTTKDALFSPIPDPFTIAGPPQDKEFRKWVSEHPCGELEVIFV